MGDRRIFTEHVLALAGGEEIRNWDEVLGALRTVLRSEMRRRGLWDLSPRYLGVEGASSWEERGSGSPRKGTGALDELLAECYAYVFVVRLVALTAQLKVRDNVDGFVFLNVRHFLHERQNAHDPIGSRTFSVLHASVLRLTETGELRIVEGDPRIRNDTVLEFAEQAVTVDPARSLGEIVARWNDELFPGLVTRTGRQQEEVAQRLRTLLADLPREGFGAFRFLDLIEPLKADIRARWALLLDGERGETAVEEGGKVVTIVHPCTDVEEKQLYRKLVDCVQKAVAVLDVNAKTRLYLSTLFQLLRVQTEEGLVPDRSAGLKRSIAAEREGEDDGQLSDRRLAEVLGIPRGRMNELFETLGKLLQECRASVGGRSRAENSSR